MKNVITLYFFVMATLAFNAYAQTADRAAMAPATTNVGAGANANVRTGVPMNAPKQHSGVSDMPAAKADDASWAEQNEYWQKQYPARPYYNAKRGYTLYEPAYQYGVDLYHQHPATPYNELDQSRLNSGWSSAHGTSSLDWSDAQLATRDAYERLYNTRKDGISMSGSVNP